VSANSIDGIGSTVELARQTAILHALLAESRSEVLEVSVHDGRGRELIMEKFPVTGAKRVLVYRTGNGFDNFAVPAAPGALVLPANEARLGLRLANSGATNAIVLYLAESQRAGVPAIYLPAGASWDGRLGNVLWAGNITAVALTAPGTLIGGEV
jgi:hypothetical protein